MIARPTRSAGASVERKRSRGVLHADARRAADVPSVDEQQHEPPDARARVRAVVGRLRRRVASGVDGSRPTYSADTTGRGRPSTVHREVLGRQPQHRTPLRVHDAHVDGDDVHGDFEDGRPALGSCAAAAAAEQQTQRQAGHRHAYCPRGTAR